MLEKILVPTDGSPCAERALDYALGLAKGEQAQVAICSAIDPTCIFGREPLTAAENVTLEIAKSAAANAVESAVAKARSLGIAASGGVDIGDAAASIVARAKSEAADAIVMGTHGCSGFKRLFMGSVAQRVLRSAPCPVLIVRDAMSAPGTPAAPPNGEHSTPIFLIRLVEVQPARFERLYGEIATFLDGPGSELPGLERAELFGSEDQRRIVILAQFHTHRDWARAQWDARLGELLEAIVTDSETLELNLYRGDRFCAKEHVSIRGDVSKTI
ncbi:MAG TPA: universal stress protein [Verrucomicrobiae bacterium]|nr:universal stress protein [Verrucomicrobiae bacterium]